MNIKDYLHLYLGSKVKGNEGTMIYTLATVHMSGEGCVLLDDNNHCCVLKTGDFKLILRPLSSMTDREILSVGALLCHVPNKVRDCRVEINRTSNTVGAIYRSPEFLSDEYFSIWTEKEYSGNGNCEIGWFESQERERKKERQKHKKRHWRRGMCHNATRYLLSRYFDLFGLIEAGLAIEPDRQDMY